jgi:hypothetical protein
LGEKSIRGREDRKEKIEMTEKLDPKNICELAINRRDFLKITATTAACILVGCGVRQNGEYGEMSYCGIACKEQCPGRKYPEQCNSCKSETGEHSKFWEDCTIRACAKEKDVLTCAHCNSYAECDDPLWDKYPILRNHIESLRDDIVG